MENQGVGAAKFFSADIIIRRASDGEERTYRSDHETRNEDGSFNDYIWSDGNFACDCNRYDFFENAGGRTPTDEECEEVPCGDTAYVVVSIKDAATGEALYSESE